MTSRGACSSRLTSLVERLRLVGLARETCQLGLNISDNFRQPQGCTSEFTSNRFVIPIQT